MPPKQQYRRRRANPKKEPNTTSSPSATPAKTSLSLPLTKLLGYIRKYRHTELQKLCTTWGGDEFAEFNGPYHLTEKAWRGCYTDGPRCGPAMVSNIQALFATTPYTKKEAATVDVSAAATASKSVVKKRPRKDKRGAKSKASKVDVVTKDGGTETDDDTVIVKSPPSKNKKPTAKPTPASLGVPTTSTTPDGESGDASWCPIPANLLKTIEKRRGPWLKELCLAGGAPLFTSLNNQYNIEDIDWWICYVTVGESRKGTLSNIKSMFTAAHIKQQHAANTTTRKSEKRVPTPVYLTGKEFMGLIHYCWMLSTCDAHTVKLICEHLGTLDQGLAFCVIPDEDWGPINEMKGGKCEVMVAMQDMFRNALRNSTLKLRPGVECPWS